MNAYDYIIIGGGCAGLSLGIHIAKNEPRKRILILENRSVYQHDKTWSFWDVEAHPFENQIQHNWSQWQVRHKDCQKTLNSKQYRYCSIPSDRFYKACMKEISLLPNLNLLMDFDVDQSKGLHFMYLLPYSPHEALIESTFISPHIHEEHVYEEAISSYLKARFQTTFYQIVRKERGILPLRTNIPNVGSSKVIPIGARAGWARASTGYAFLPIQKAIQNLAVDLQEQKPFNLDIYLDKIFLAFLHDHPQSAPRIFYDLFHRNAPDRLIRFLTGHWSFVDLLQVLISMPKIAMIKQALRLLTKGGT